MSIVSFGYLAFLIVTAFIYYIIPKRFQWVILLISSMAFLSVNSALKTLVYFATGVLVTYFGALYISKAKSEKAKKNIMILTLTVVIAILCSLKYTNMFLRIGRGFGSIMALSFSDKAIMLLAPLGISYYTLSLIGYVLDVYWGKSIAQTNVLKHTLFTSYFPHMVSGPIVRYDDLSPQFFVGHKFDYVRVKSGFVRILWGYFKKLVIADRLSILTSTVFENTTEYQGYYIVVAVLCFAFQIYCDFSGCMDIVIGASEVFGIILPENFRRPFLSKDLSEFWRRWHITLGLWAKDYIFYPLLKSKFFQKIGKLAKKKIGKRYGKMIPTFLGLLTIWIIIGIWHGGNAKYVFAAGIVPWFFLVTGQIFSPIAGKFAKRLNINTECFSYELFCRLRTLFCMCIIWLFANAPSFKGNLKLLKDLYPLNNSSALLRESLYSLNLVSKDFKIILFGLFLVLIVSILQERGIQIRKTLFEQNIIFQWGIELTLIFIILIYGVYGPTYNPANFIYGGF